MDNKKGAQEPRFVSENTAKSLKMNGDRSGIRTLDLMIKSHARNPYPERLTAFLPQIRHKDFWLTCRAIRTLPFQIALHARSDDHKH